MMFIMVEDQYIYEHDALLNEKCIHSVLLYDLSLE